MRYETPIIVIPAKAGIQHYLNLMDSGSGPE